MKFLLTIALISIQFGCLLAQTNTEVYLPKKITFGNKCYQTYQFDNEFRLTKSVFSINFAEGEHDKIETYSCNIAIKYDKKTSNLSEVKVYECFWERKDGPNKDVDFNTDSYTYKFPYNESSFLNMDIIYQDRNYKKTAYSGQIQINTKGELTSAKTTIDNLLYRAEYDDNGNILQNTLGNEAAYFFKYGNKKGMLSDSKTPLWIFPAFFNFTKNYQPLFPYLDRGLLVNNMEEAAFATLNEDTKETIVSKTYNFIYEYNPQGYPVSITAKNDKGETLPPVLIEYQVKKIK